MVTVRLQTSDEDENEDGDESHEEDSDEDRFVPNAGDPMPSPIHLIRSIYTEDGVKGLWGG